MSDTGGPFLQPGGLGQFAIKTCIVAAVISISTMFVANWMIDSAQFFLKRSVLVLRSELQSVGPIGGPQFWRALEREIERAAAPESDLPPEKKQKLIDEIHVIATRWRPFLDAFTAEMQKPASNLPSQA